MCTFVADFAHRCAFFIFRCFNFQDERNYEKYSVA